LILNYRKCLPQYDGGILVAVFKIEDMVLDVVDLAAMDK